MEIILIQYQPTIALGLLKGKMGGTVFQQGNITAIIRLKGYRKGAPSPSRAAATAAITQLSTNWKIVVATDLDAWKTAASLYPFVNKFGVTYYASAYQCYIAYNRWILATGAPAYLTPVAPVVPINENPFLIGVTSLPNFQLDWAADPGVDQFVFLYATSPCSPGRNSNNPKLKLITFTNMNGATSLPFYDAYVAVFGTPPVGQQIIVKVVTVPKTYGFPYYPTVIPFITQFP